MGPKARTSFPRPPSSVVLLLRMDKVGIQTPHVIPDPDREIQFFDLLLLVHLGWIGLCPMSKDLSEAVNY